MGPDKSGMRKLLVVHATGLTPDLACRGDVAANLSDIIAEGAYAALAEPPDVTGLVRGLPSGAATLVEHPCLELAAFDAEVGRLRDRAAAAGASIALLSESVFVSQLPLRGLGAGRSLGAVDVERLLSDMVKG
jgi:hypothetical protein